MQFWFLVVWIVLIYGGSFGLLVYYINVRVYLSLTFGLLSLCCVTL